jgi:peptidoglycan/LPS O-acetylase OafA/YrhL
MLTAINQKHVVGIDFLRFVAACFVVAFHLGFLMGIHPASQAARASQNLVAYPELYHYSYFGWIGVQIFFVISGFVIAFSGEKASPFVFLRSRVVRLGPGVWICAPLTLAAILLVGFLPADEVARGFRHSMAFLPWGPWIDESYWTLGIEISFYTLVFALICCRKFSLIRVLAIAIGLMSSAFWIAATTVHAVYGNEAAAIMNQLENSRLLRLLLVQHGLFFSIGVLLWCELIKRHAKANVFWIVVFAATGCLQIAANNRAANVLFTTDYGPYVACTLFLASVVFVVWAVKFNAVVHALRPQVVSAIKTAGMMTFPLYLLHQVIGSAMVGGMVLYGINRWIALALMLLAVLTLAWVVATKIEPWLQSITKYLLTSAHDRYKLLRFKVAK